MRDEGSSHAEVTSNLSHLRMRPVVFISLPSLPLRVLREISTRKR